MVLEYDARTALLQHTSCCSRDVLCIMRCAAWMHGMCAYYVEQVCLAGRHGIQPAYIQPACMHARMHHKKCLTFRTTLMGHNLRVTIQAQRCRQRRWESAPWCMAMPPRWLHSVRTMMPHAHNDRKAFVQNELAVDLAESSKLNDTSAISQTSPSFPR